jgi:AcrR family transcriptional regulator
MAATVERRRLPVAERRELITEAAGRLFGELGYDGTRLDDIAAAAGVTKPVLYRHFDSKRDLYLALLRRHRDDLPTFVGEMPRGSAPRDWLRGILESWLEYVEAHSYAWKMLFRDSGGGPEVQAFRRDVHARAREVLAEVIRSVSESRISPREAHALAEMMSMGMASLVLWWMDNPGTPREVLVDAMTRVWVGLVTAPV